MLGIYKCTILTFFRVVYFVSYLLKDLFCGIVDASKIGLVTSIQRVMEHVYMEALAHPAPDADDEEGNCFMVKNQLLPGLRSFCSALKGRFNTT